MRRLALAIGVIMLMAAGATAKDDRILHSLSRLSPGERLVQLCDYTVMRRIKQNHHKYHPDRAVADARGDPRIVKNTVVATGGAFRSRGHWYALSFTCTAAPDTMKVLSFTYKIGDEIPHDKWASYDLW